MASQAYPHGKYHIIRGDTPLDPSVNNMHALLLWEGAAFNPSHEFVSDVIAGGLEVSGGSYARQALASDSLTIVGSNVVYTSSPMTFSALPTGHTIVAMVIYQDLGGDSQNPVLAWYDGGSYPNDLPKDTTGGDLVVTPHATDGWIKV